MAGTWHALANQPGFNTSTMILLTDGRIMVQEEGTAHWHALSPDAHGSYLNGTWSTLHDMSGFRRYYASAVLNNGRVLIIGGEQSDFGEDTNKGEIYDPVADSWNAIAAPPWSQVGDASCCLLPDGRLMIGALLNGDCIAYDPDSDSWDTLASASGRINEETWILLPDDTVITAQTFSPFGSEKYLIGSDSWQSEGTPPVTLVDPDMNEIGPAMLMYNGKVIYFGAANSSGHAKTAIYTPAGTPTGHGTWAAGPNVPKVGKSTIVCNDCPATLLPSGKVLFTGAPYVHKDWGSPVYFFEYDPATNSIVQAASPSNHNSVLYMSRMMLLPTGEVLFSPSSADVELYRPDPGPKPGWRPGITSITGGWFGQHTLLGTQLTGLSQANIYGDDCTPVTNYPLVRLSNTAGQVYYARTFGFSTRAVSTPGAMQSCHFDTSAVPNGNYDARVVVNGIASAPVPLNVFNVRKPDIVDHGEKRIFDVLNKVVSEGDPFNRWQWIGDPEEAAELNALRGEVRSLGNEVKRLATLISAQSLPAVGAEIARAASVAEKHNGADVAAAEGPPR